METNKQPQLMSELQQVHDEIAEVKFTLEGIQGNVESIKNLLTGNPLDKTDGGMIGRVIKLEEQVKQLEAFKNRAIWVAIGLAMGAGYSLDKILQLFK